MSNPKFFNPDTVTADHVATAAGVSRWTVARAFKKDASISKKSRDRVLSVAENLGYVPDLQAASLSSDRSNLVAVMIDDFSNPHKLVVLERLTRILRLAGWGSLLVNMLDNADASSALLSASQRRVDAAIVVGSRFDEKVLETAIGARRVKKLIIFARTSLNPNSIDIYCDDASAMREMGDYLYAKGKRKLLYVAGPDEQSTTLDRKTVFQSHWKKLTGEHCESIPADQYDSTRALEAVVKALEGKAPSQLPDTLVCENDILAFGAIDALRYRLGLRVPEDIAVTGFDDIPLAQSPAYDLTTFRQPITEMAEALIRVLEGDTSPSFCIKGTFVPRGSA